MPDAETPVALLTSDDIRRWVEERDELVRQFQDVGSKLASKQQKLDAVVKLFPDNDVISKLIGRPVEVGLHVGMPMLGAPPRAHGATQQDHAKAKPPSFATAIKAVLAQENGGRTPAWVRDRLSQDPDMAVRVRRTPNSVGSTLSRLVEVGSVTRLEGLYYLTEVYAAIQRGEVEEDRTEVPAPQSFNAIMHAKMRSLGRRFTASDAVAVVKSDPELMARINGQPNRVYSWLSREAFKHKFLRDGEFYSYPSEGEEAPEGEPSGASHAREASTSLFDEPQRSETLAV